jgi:hypothetical protein
MRCRSAHPFEECSEPGHAQATVLWLELDLRPFIRGQSLGSNRTLYSVGMSKSEQR